MQLASCWRRWYLEQTDNSTEANMAVDIGNATLIGAASALIGFGASYFVFKKLIFDIYGKGKERANSVYYWCGFIAMIAVGQGVGSIINEMLFVATNNASFDVNRVVKGGVQAVFLPLILFIVAFFISKFKSNASYGTSKIVREVAESPSSASNSKANLTIIFLLILIVLLVGYNFLSPNQFKNLTEKTHDFAHCIACTRGECKDDDMFTGFKVMKNQVYVFTKGSDGQSRISAYPDSTRMTCAILPEKNFAFDCDRVETDSGLFSQTTLTFDGKGAFSYRMTQEFPKNFLGSNVPGINVNIQCNVK